MSVSNRALRKFLVQRFNDEELEALCQDYFPRVYQDFTADMSKGRKVTRLLDYCKSRNEVPNLLAALQRERPSLYEKYLRLTAIEPKSKVDSKRSGRDPDQIFLSHAYEDAEFAHRLAKDLRREGWQVWIAPESIRPGEKWVEAINRGLKESAIFLLILTPYSADSRWVKDEIGFAIGLENKGQARFYSLDVAEAEAPPLWSVRQHIPFREDYETGLHLLLTTLGEPTVVEPHSATEEATGYEQGELFRGPLTGIFAGVKGFLPFRWLAGGLMTIVIIIGLFGWRSSAGGVSANDSTTRPSPGTHLAEVELDPTSGMPLLALPATHDPVVESGSAPTDVPIGVHTPAPVPTPTASSTSTPAGPVAGEIRVAILGVGRQVEQIYVPAGSFIMGSDVNVDDERPAHVVALDAYWIDRTEVTNDRFAVFTTETNYRTRGERDGGGYIYNEVVEESGFVKGADWQHPRGPESTLTGLGDHPVVLVTWDDADTYCKWAGGRLPTEAEWEFAAGGPESLFFPWGNEWDRQLLNSCDANCPYQDRADTEVDDGYRYTAPVGSYPDGASWVGAVDMAGNVWEWVNDWHAVDYYANSPAENPTGPEEGTKRVLRGGTWDVTRPNLVRTAFRGESGGGNNALNGFRCAYYE